MNCLWCHKLNIQMTWKNLFTISDGHLLCDSCYSRLEKINLQTSCERCCAETESEICKDCKKWDNNFLSNRPLIKNISVFKYNYFLKEIITKWKYRGDYVLAHSFKKDFITQFKQNFLYEKDLLIVPIPLSQERLLERGFNQSIQLARFLTNEIIELLKRTHTEKQAKKSRFERLTSENPFICEQNVESPVLLVDDIYTTGATIYAAAERLKQKGCPKIYSITLARG